jgi:ribonuclease HII
MPPKMKKEAVILDSCYHNDSNYYLEIGIDEAGRGPMFGRLYVAAVIVPKDNSFDHSKMKDSKKFSSEKKINEAAEYIKTHAIAWTVQYEEAEEIDKLNIRQAVLKCMHKCIDALLEKMPENNYFLLVDGNDFKPYVRTTDLSFIPYKCVEGGDNKYSAIAAASILAKVSRDKYIHDLCNEHIYLDERYGLNKNKGYGTKAHLDGIKAHGISPWHRKSYGICKNYS